MSDPSIPLQAAGCEFEEGRSKAILHVGWVNRVHCDKENYSGCMIDWLRCGSTLCCMGLGCLVNRSCEKAVVDA